MSIAELPALNATLNALAAVLLATGYVMIRRRQTGAHRRCMIAAFVASALFLTSYVIYHANVGSKLFPGTGTLRLIYFFILGTHVVLAAVILPMAIVTLTRALRGRFEHHKRLARWTLPLWIYVSVTGVVIYVMLY
jgi:putative membrane protein